MTELIIVDGSNYVYRAFYSHKDFKSESGMPTGAIFGFIKTMQKITKNNTHADIVVVFDAKGNSFRSNIDDDYKGTRSKVPEDLKLQFPLIREACDMCGYSHVEDTIHDIGFKYEADDIIASLVKKNLLTMNYKYITIYTGDKDLYQLIGDYNIKNKLPCTVRINDSNLKRIVTQDDIIKKFGVDSTKLREWLMLVGDTSDNISGCHGIGKKIASSLLNKYGSINNIYAHLNELPKTVQNKFNNAKEVLPKMQDLVTLRYDYPCNDIISPVYSKKRYIDFCKKYGMKSLLPKKVKCEF